MKTVGLRPKQKFRQAGNTTVFPSKSVTRFYGNPLDRLCESILNWKLMDDVCCEIRSLLNPSTKTEII